MRGKTIAAVPGKSAEELRFKTVGIGTDASGKLSAVLHIEGIRYGCHMLNGHHGRDETAVA